MRIPPGDGDWVNIGPLASPGRCLGSVRTRVGKCGGSYERVKEESEKSWAGHGKRGAEGQIPHLWDWIRSPRQAPARTHQHGLLGAHPHREGSESPASREEEHLGEKTQSVVVCVTVCTLFQTNPALENLEFPS